MALALSMKYIKYEADIAGSISWVCNRFVLEGAFFRRKNKNHVVCPITKLLTNTNALV